MKTLAGWIVGVFGLGLAVGSFYGSTAAEEEAERERGSLQQAVESAPLVDCGTGRETVLEPVLEGGKTSVRFKCVSKAPEPAAAAAPRTVAPAVVAPPATPARVERTAPSADPNAEEKSSRSVKDSALIIGGSAGAGAGIGAIAKGKKGAALGAAIGGVAGAVYDLATRNKER